jgi:protein-S-isoprenylcysteine O-methyltransferase Ste14
MESHFDRLTILPVMLVISLGLLMLIVDLAGMGVSIAMPLQIPIAGLIFIVGTAIIAIGGYSFRKANTTVDPTQPEQASQLVTTGIYSVSRNPMYIGFFFWLLACVIIIGNLLNVVSLPIFIGLVNRLYIMPEENALLKLFDREFIEYKKRVRR